MRHLLGTKIEAFFDRGMSDILVSKDLEDIVLLIDGRLTLVDEPAAASSDLKQFVASGLEDILNVPAIREVLEGHFYGSLRSEEHLALLLQRIERIRNLAG